MDPRGQLLRAALGFAGCSMPSYDRALQALRTWLDSWSGIGRVAVGMARQGYDLQLTRYDEKGWRATFYTTGDGALADARDVASSAPSTATVTMTVVKDYGKSVTARPCDKPFLTRSSSARTRANSFSKRSILFQASSSTPQPAQRAISSSDGDGSASRSRRSVITNPWIRLQGSGGRAAERLQHAPMSVPTASVGSAVGFALMSPGAAWERTPWQRRR
jgi:hypothetical protein